MAKLYEDDLRNVKRDEITDTLAARASPLGAGLEQAGRAFSPAVFKSATVMPQGAVPAIGGAGGSVLPLPPAQRGAMGAMPTLQTLGANQRRRRMY